MCIVCKAVHFPVLLFFEVLPNLITFQINVYSLFRSVFYIIYNFCTDGISENIDNFLFERSRMVCIYRHAVKLMCTATFDKE